MAKRLEALRATFGRQALRRSLLVAVVVGTTLNAINQGTEVWAGHPPSIWKVVLTYLTPFAVASYGTYGALRNR
jgi:hypothetical protein